MYLCCGLFGWLFDEPHHLYLFLSLLRLCVARLSLDLGTDEVCLHREIRSEEGQESLEGVRLHYDRFLQQFVIDCQLKGCELL